MKSSTPEIPWSFHLNRVQYNSFVQKTSSIDHCLDPLVVPTSSSYWKTYATKVHEGHFQCGIIRWVKGGCNGDDEGVGSLRTTLTRDCCSSSVGLMYWRFYPYRSNNDRRWGVITPVIKVVTNPLPTKYRPLIESIPVLFILIFNIIFCVLLIKIN